MGGDRVQMARFFVDPVIQGEKFIRITGADHIHIKNVLRLKPGGLITVCDEKGTDYECVISEISKEEIVLKIAGRSPSIAEPPIEIILYQAIPKSDKMDTIIQKSVELGVSSIIPVITEHTVVKVASEKDERRKCERWNRIAMEAAKQCGRGIIPPVLTPINFDAAINMSSECNVVVLPYELERNGSLKTLLKNQTLDHKVMLKIAVIIGPEGGFSEKEISVAVRYGIKPISLGPRILRSDTAGIAVISAIMYELGDMCLKNGVN
jgi:16S rRNA (uracil1498-N3)-methyltransferase